MQGHWRVGLVALLLITAVLLSACCYQLETASDEGLQSPPTTRTATATAPATTDVPNPTAVGQAMDALARPAIEQVYGSATLDRASQGEALIVSLQYEIPVDPKPEDGQTLQDAFIAQGATPDPANSEIDYHGDGAEFILRYDTGNPEFPTVRVGVTPGFKLVSVNADRATN